MCKTIKHVFKTNNKEKLLKLYKIMEEPMLLYGCEKWTSIKRAQKEK